tara:strand:+ start:116 stop:502 length:387 start_codon:yes stop_codon:yes gene_type:complete
MTEKQYKNIKEVSKLLNIKEHVIRYWDSIDPKTDKIRIQGLSTRNRGGIRYFNRDNINKLEQLKFILFENGKHNYSLDLANKILSSKKNKVSDHTKSNITQNVISSKKAEIKLKLDEVLFKLRDLTKL